MRGDVVGDVEAPEIAVAHQHVEYASFRTHAVHFTGAQRRDASRQLGEVARAIDAEARRSQRLRAAVDPHALLVVREFLGEQVVRDIALQAFVGQHRPRCQHDARNGDERNHRARDAAAQAQPREPLVDRIHPAHKNSRCELHAGGSAASL